MARYYNAETLLEFVRQNVPHLDGETTMKCVERAIEEAPTADVVEVKHGEWLAYDTEPYGDGIGEKATKWYKCSECRTDALGRCYEDEYYSYPLRTDCCPKCGAKMDGGKTDVSM